MLRRCTGRRRPRDFKGKHAQVQHHSAKGADKISAEALGRIAEEKLTPTPENYELWYIYYAQSNADITRAIDVLLSSGQKITEEHCLELHQRFLGDRTDSNQVREASDKIQQTIRDVSNAVVKVKDTTIRYNDTLNAAAARM